MLQTLPKLILILATALAGCSTPAAMAASAQASAADASRPITDKALESYRLRLLETSFAIASAIPHEPHIKDRSRSQQAVIEACLILDQPTVAERWAAKIDNWRRGVVLAELARYRIENESREGVEAMLDQATGIAETTEDWRRDNIRVRVGAVYALMDRDALAESYEQDVETSEQGKIAAARASKGDAASYDDLVAEVDAMIAAGNYDLAQNALRICCELFDRFYDQPDKRSAVEAKARQGWRKQPYTLRIDILCRMAESALVHGDREKALSLVSDADEYLAKPRWPLRYAIPLTARLAALRHRCGDSDAARKALDASLDRFKRDGGAIVTIYRAETLCPVAESYSRLGDTASALAVYKLAVEQAIENPNSRPRAEDLSAICRSMALSAVEPDKALWSRINQLSEGLGRPW